MRLPLVVRPRANWELDDIIAWTADRDVFIIYQITGSAIEVLRIIRANRNNRLLPGS